MTVARQTVNRNAVFSGADILVTDGQFEGAKDLLVISFPVRSARPSFSNQGFAERWLHKRQISSLEVKVSWNHWFQVEETEEAMEAIRRIAADYSRVVAYGSSMGGYAAIACSKAIGAHAVVALSPQYSIDPAKAPWEKRWIEDSKVIASRCGFPRDDIAEQINPNADIVVVADPWDMDKQHATRIKAASERIEWLLGYGCGHSAGAGLRDTGLLGAFVISMFEGTSKVGYWRQQLRAARTKHHHYLTRRAEVTHEQGPALYPVALDAARRALKLVLAMPGPLPRLERMTIRRSSVILSRLGYEDEALESLRAADAIGACDGPISRTYASILIKQGALDEAERRIAIARGLGERSDLCDSLDRSIFAKRLRAA